MMIIFYISQQRYGHESLQPDDNNACRLSQICKQPNGVPILQFINNDFSCSERFSSLPVEVYCYHRDYVCIIIYKILLMVR